MEQNNCNKKAKKYTHINEKDRYKLEALLSYKCKPKEIAKHLEKDISTIYREIKRGTIRQLNSDLSVRFKYRSDVAQNDYTKKGKNKERSLKIGKDKKLEEHIRKKLKEDKYSPDAIIGEIEEKGLEFEKQICTKTLYNYIDKGLFAGISNADLWEKGSRKGKRKSKNRKLKECYVMPRRITERPVEINERLEYGHWEGDCVKGPLGTKESLFTLTERKTLEEIIIKLEAATQENIKKAIDELERQYGTRFKIKFKSITFDNGSEFVNWKYLELSVLDKDAPRTITYFAHPYSSWERGSNENQNRMIRRFIPKGTPISSVSEEEVENVEKWMNNYPRKKLGYKSAREVSDTHMQNINNLEFSLDSFAL